MSNLISNNSSRKLANKGEKLIKLLQKTENNIPLNFVIFILKLAEFTDSIDNTHLSYLSPFP